MWFCYFIFVHFAILFKMHLLKLSQCVRLDLKRTQFCFLKYGMTPYYTRASNPWQQWKWTLEIFVQLKLCNSTIHSCSWKMTLLSLISSFPRLRLTLSNLLRALTRKRSYCITDMHVNYTRGTWGLRYSLHYDSCDLVKTCYTTLVGKLMRSIIHYVSKTLPRHCATTFKSPQKKVVNVFKSIHQVKPSVQLFTSSQQFTQFEL